ncbi:hypothetical protein AC1659_30895, partial [Rhodococcus erythropolis]|uniref:hypothetical protein n=1 Tax=Rhodococcus erythropolis TaxID=1833 RepID=UPI001BAD1639
LEPTNIAHIDGPDGPERYEMVDRKPEIGEKVIVTESDDFPKGFVDSVKEVDDFHDNGSFFLVNGVLGENFLDAEYEEYRVLVPVEAVEDEPQPADPIDVIASLAQEVASLKRTVDRHRDEIDTLHKDNRTLGEELERLKEPKETEETAPIEAPLVFVQRKIGDAFDVYQDGKKLRGIRHIRIDAAEGEFTTHDIEFVSGATEEERP